MTTTTRRAVHNSVTPALIQQFRDAVANGEARDRIATRYDVARSTVYRHTAGLTKPIPCPPTTPVTEMNRWQDRAACATTDCDPELFGFPDQSGFVHHTYIRPALAYCTRCPVKAECFAAGRAGFEWGVWGGVLLQAGEVKPERRRSRKSVEA